MADMVVKAVLSADGKQLVGTVDQSVQSLDKLKSSAKSVGDQSKAAANDHAALGKAIGETGNLAKDSADKFKLSTLQITELTYAGRHLFEQLGTGTPITTILTTQVGHLTYAFGDAEQLSGLFSIALRSVWTYAGLAAGAILATAAAANSYADARRGLDNALAAQGNPFGLSAQQAEDAATSIHKSATVTQGDARAMAEALNQNNVQPKYWDDLAKAARGYGDSVPGATAAQGLSLFAEALKNPAEGAKKLAGDLNLMSGQEAEHIAAVQRSSGVYVAQGELVKAISDRYGDWANKIGVLGLALRAIGIAVKDIPDIVGKSIDKLVPGARTTGDKTVNNTQDNQIHDLMTEYATYDQQISKTRENITYLEAATKDASLSDAAHQDAVKALSGAHFSLAMAIHAHQQQLLALNPLEQERQSRIKSLIAGSDQQVAQANAQASSSEAMAAATGGSTLAQQRLADSLALQRQLLPEVTALQFAHGAQAEKLRAIIEALTGATSRQSVADHGADAARDVMAQITQLSGNAPMAGLDAALAQNVDNLDHWKELTKANLQAAGLYNENYGKLIQTIYDDRLQQLYEDDLSRRRDWASGSALAMLDLTRATEDWASTSRGLTQGMAQEFENDFVSAVISQKDPLSAFFNWYIEQLVRVIYQQKLAASFNSVSGGLTDFLGGLLGFGGSKTGVVSTFEGGGTDFLGGIGQFADISGVVLHDGGNVGGAGTSRTVSSALFAGAPRFHSGTGGLNVGERAAILKDNEHVSTADQYAALTARPQVIYLPAAANNNGAPNVTINTINNSGVALQGRKGKTTRQADGGLSIDFIVDQVEQKAAQNIHEGNSPIASMLEQTHGITRQPSGS